MKPRKEGETDEQYIRRLEDCIAALKQNHKRWSQDWNKISRTLLPAAEQAGMILNAAAEITGMKDDHKVQACVDGLGKISGARWCDDHFEIPELPSLPRPDAEKYGGDAEMILKSALEICKNNRAPWESWDDLVPQFKGVDPKDLDWEGIANEVFDAFMDLDFSRGLLRLDLRSSMYDHCFQRISRALQEADRRVREERLEELGGGPKQLDDTIPFSMEWRG